MVQNRRSRISYKYRKIICNPKENWIIVENTHEAIIDKESFNKVQQILPKQHQRNDKKELIGSNGVHPTMNGYLQIGDVFYRALVADMKNEK